MSTPVEVSRVHKGQAAKRGGPTLRADFLWTFFGNGLYAACQWAILVLLAKTSTPEVVGQYSLALAVAMPVITFATFQLRSVQVSDTREEHGFRDYLGFRIWTMIGAMVVLTAICLGLRYPNSTFILVEVLGAALAVEAISDIYYGRMQSRHCMDRIAKSMIGRGLLSVSGITLVMLLTKNILLAMLLLLVCRLAVTMFYDMHACDLAGADGVFRPAFRWNVQRTLLNTAFPVGLASVLIALNTAVPRYFIAWSVGPRELGIFAALSFFQSTGNTIVGALGQAAFGRLARAFADHNIPKFLALLLKMTCAGLALGLAGIVITAFKGKQILEIMYRPEYAQHAILLTYLMIAAGMGYLSQFFGYAVTAARIFVAQIPLSFIVVLTLTGTCYLWVPKFGVAGAIWAIAAAMLIQFLGYSSLLFMSIIRNRQGQTGPSIRKLTVELMGCFSEP